MASKFVVTPTIPSFLLLDPLLKAWLVEDMGRGDRVTEALLSRGTRSDEARWVAKETGVIAGLPIAERVFQLLDPAVRFEAWVLDGETVIAGQPIAALYGPFDALLSGERGTGRAELSDAAQWNCVCYAKICRDLGTLQYSLCRHPKNHARTANLGKICV